MYVTSKIITTESFLFVSFNTLSRNKNFGSRHLTSNSLFLRFTVGFFFSNSTPLKVFVKYSYYYWNRIIQENLEKKKILSNSNFKCTCASDVILQLCGFITIFEECKLLLWFFPFWQHILTINFKFDCLLLLLMWYASSHTFKLHKIILLLWPLFVVICY